MIEYAPKLAIPKALKLGNRIVYKTKYCRESQEWKTGIVAYVSKAHIIIQGKGELEDAVAIKDLVLREESDENIIRKAFALAKTQGTVLSYDEFRVRPHAYTPWVRTYNLALEIK